MFILPNVKSGFIQPPDKKGTKSTCMKSLLEMRVSKE